MSFTKPYSRLKTPRHSKLGRLTVIAALLASAAIAVSHALRADENTDSGFKPAQTSFNGVYVVNTQILMPHLEENLRYANNTLEISARQFDPNRFFPILKHQSLTGCTLKQSAQALDTLTYLLICSGTNQTQGNASITVTGANLKGILNIRMGGKNMTFSQRMSASPKAGTATNPPPSKDNN